MFTVLSASYDGYVRLYKIKETKNLEIVAQLNVMDRILSTIQLNLNTIDNKYIQENYTLNASSAAYGEDSKNEGAEEGNYSENLIRSI